MKTTLMLLLVVLSQLLWGQLSMVRLAELPKEMYETSGLVFYDNSYLLTHNDGGNKSEIFVLNLQGDHIKTIEIEDTQNKDWEDLTTDNKGQIYIGDFGNNLNERELCQIYILPKNFIESEKVEPKKISFTYEDQNEFPPTEEKLNYDCEAFFWKNDSLYLFTKCRTKPFTGITYIYVLPAKPGKYVAKKIGSISLCSSDWRFCSVTSADYNEKFNLLVVLTYSRLYIISDFRGNNFWSGKIKSYQLPFVKQREAVCFKTKNSWYMTDEYRKALGGGNLYEVRLKK